MVNQDHLYLLTWTWRVWMSAGVALGGLACGGPLCLALRPPLPVREAHLDGRQQGAHAEAAVCGARRPTPEGRHPHHRLRLRAAGVPVSSTPLTAYLKVVLFVCFCLYSGLSGLLFVFYSSGSCRPPSAGWLRGWTWAKQNWRELSGSWASGFKNWRTSRRSPRTSGEACVLLLGRRFPSKRVESSEPGETLNQDQLLIQTTAWFLCSRNRAMELEAQLEVFSARYLQENWLTNN